MKKKMQIAPSKDKSEAATTGKTLLNGGIEAIVMYRRKKWTVKDLLIHLADRVRELERNQCKPNAGCLFEGQKYIEEKYIGDYQPPPSFY